MKKQKFLASLLSIVMLAALVAGCSTPQSAGTPAPSDSQQPPSTESSAPSAPAEDSTPAPAEIVWAGWSGEEESTKGIFTEMREGFQAKSGNTVSWVGWPWADTAQQLLIRLQGNEKLDIAQVDIGMFATLSEAGVLADLNDVLGADYLTENFDEASLAIGNRDGRQLALPWAMAPLTVVYNPEILSAAGWDKAPATIAEFEQCLADIAAYDADIIPYAVSTKDTTAARDFVPWLWTFGGSIFDESGASVINSEAGVKCVEWYQGLLGKDHIRMDMSRFDARQLFAQGKVAFYDDAVVAKGTAISNGVSVDDVTNVCSAMMRPVLNAGDPPQAYAWGHMLVIFDKSGVKEQAGAFAKYLVGEDVAPKYFEQNGLPPVLKSITASDLVQKDAYLKGFMDAAATSRLEETALMANGGEINTIITEELQAALLGAKSAQQAMDDAASRINAAV